MLKLYPPGMRDGELATGTYLAWMGLTDCGDMDMCRGGGRGRVAPAGAV